MKKKLLMTLMLSTLWCVATRAQMIAANIDALWLATLSPSIGLEMVVGERSTIGLNGLFVNKPYGNNIKLIEVQPEYRYYFSGRPMFREFIGIGAIGGTHNIEWKGKIYDGTNFGLGLIFGYVMSIGKRVNVDFNAGFVAVFLVALMLFDCIKSIATLQPGVPCLRTIIDPCLTLHFAPVVVTNTPVAPFSNSRYAVTSSSTSISCHLAS